MAWMPPPYESDRILPVYQASKVQQEQEVWKFVKEQKPNFAVNTVLPDFTVGQILNVDKQGYPSSVGMLQAAIEGNMAYASILPPKHEINVQDCALLHVAALLHPDTTGERIFGMASPKKLDSYYSASTRAVSRYSVY
jgi:hypothetical protein